MIDALQRPAWRSLPLGNRFRRQTYYLLFVFISEFISSQYYDQFNYVILFKYYSYYACILVK